MQEPRPCRTLSRSSPQASLKPHQAKETGSRLATLPQIRVGGRAERGCVVVLRPVIGWLELRCRENIGCRDGIGRHCCLHPSLDDLFG
jgi:hypothetical protein